MDVSRSVSNPVITVVIATKDRPEKLFRLLETVRTQDLQDFECIVVDDGSTSATRARYEDLWRSLDERFRLIQRNASGGPSRARNEGIRSARSDYIALCDDDDFWVRADHLSCAVRSLDASGAELYFADMQTCVDGAVRNPSWYSVISYVDTRRPLDGETDVYQLLEKDMVCLMRFKILHANTLIVARRLFERIGCYWEKISFAEDHDISFRLADAAQGILYRKRVTATQDLTPHQSIASMFAQRERNLFGIVAVYNAQLSIKSTRLRRVCKANRAWRLMELAQAHLDEGDRRVALDLAREAFFVWPSRSALTTLLRCIGLAPAAVLAAGALTLVVGLFAGQ